ncbi:MAG: pyridoxal phosphate-dependent aminotransferase [candidate division KSB1 bacterium]|nr:pyridoxal phosphate-dependent aminotransferase [candidate division KSB1 bacterium]MDZ7274458.1 pyridoxal phosphate-dependent aminotransferase [candidate division KSB1 bacterium]MDZ7284880.1 pyridoxal phosphate-dependent aminotransferase [candidate division KSB1 bacterium]MDZ7297699.1 pyridoxal phosphate-dependent aminotransferase [candidate division KSB1 bacterium]MDZ7305877.1 pyridoxal phosphate-dependent aminotransferase [candidate division KSB1 bacterium]
MQFQESEFCQRIQPSETLALTTLVAELRRQGKSIIDLGAGEPDFDTPEDIKAAGIRAIREGKTRYTPNVGTLALREAICRHLQTLGGPAYTPAQVVVSNGAKQAIHNALLALCNPGDEVIVPAPYWVSYPEQVKMTGATPVFVPTEDATGFKITPAALAAAITPRTRLLILNSPGNPTGAVYSVAELTALAAIIREKQIFVLADEIYFKLVYRETQTCSLACFPELREQLILINGFSKAYAMTGWRLGYLAAPVAIARAAAKIQSHTTSNPCSISQEAGCAALAMDEQTLVAMRDEFERRRDFVHAAVNRMPGLSACLPGGAFYLFVNVSALLGRRLFGQTIAAPADLVKLLLEHAGVALVGGEAFGSRQHVRISYANSMENLRTAMRRLEETLQQVEI